MAAITRRENKKKDNHKEKQKELKDLKGKDTKIGTT